MSYAAIDWAMAKIIPDVNAKFCLVVLAHHHNDKTGLCCPSISTIAEKMGVKSINTVKKAIKNLTAANLISFSRVTGASGEIIRTEYTLNFENDQFLKGVGHRVTEGGSPRDGGVYHHVTEGVSSRDGEVGHCVTGVGHDMTPNKEINIESINKEINIRAIQPTDTDQLNAAAKLTEETKPTRSTLKKPDGVSDEVWTEWKAHKRKVSKNCTQRMVEALVREAGIAGITPEQAMTIQLEKGWRGFEAKYLENTKPFSRNRFVEKKQSERSYSLDW